MYDLDTDDPAPELSPRAAKLAERARSSADIAKAVVASLILILVLDYFVTKALL